MFQFKLASVLFGMSAVVLAQQLPFNAASPAISPNLADLLTVNPRASIFYDYARENSGLSALLLAPGESTTLFVPTNSVIQALARKPSAGPADRSFTIKSRNGEEEDRAYLEKWLLLHVTGAIDLESETEFEMMSGKKCSLKLADDSARGDFSIQRAFHRMRLMPADIEVIDVIEAKNGRIIFINGSLSVED